VILFGLRTALGIESDLADVDPIHPERHRAPRHSFVAGIHLTDLQSEAASFGAYREPELIRMLCLEGDAVPEGYKVRLQIWHAGVNLIAIGKVAYSLPNSGMGMPSSRSSQRVRKFQTYGSRI